MALINTPKSFDKAQIDSTILTKIEEFVDYVNQQVDQLTRALQNQLTFSENFKAKVLTISAYHNRQFNVSESAAIIMPLSVLGDSIVSYSSVVSNAGVQSVTFKFGNAVPVRTRTVTKSAPFATYEVESVANLQVGDKISVTANVNAANNGTFILAEVGTTTVTVYNSAAVAASGGSNYAGAYETAKQVTLLLLS